MSAGRPRQPLQRPPKQRQSELHRFPVARRRQAAALVARRRQAAALVARRRQAAALVARRRRTAALSKRARQQAVVALRHPWNRATPARPHRQWLRQRLRRPRALVADLPRRVGPRNPAAVARVEPPLEAPSPGRWGSPQSSGRGNIALGAQLCAAQGPARRSSGGGNRAARIVDRDPARGPRKGTRWVPRRMDRPAVSCPRILSGRSLRNLVFQHLLLLGPGLQDHACADRVE